MLLITTKKCYLPKRYIVIFLLFLGTSCISIMETNLSIALIAMTSQKVGPNGTVEVRLLNIYTTKYPTNNNIPHKHTFSELRHKYITKSFEMISVTRCNEKLQYVYLLFKSATYHERLALETYFSGHVQDQWWHSTRRIRHSRLEFVYIFLISLVVILSLKATQNLIFRNNYGNSSVWSIIKYLIYQFKI